MTSIEPSGACALSLHSELQQRLPMWVVYDRPTDFPENVIARMWLTLPRCEPTSVAVIGGTVDAVRDALPPGLVRLDRNPGDEPQIVEVWL